MFLVLIKYVDSGRSAWAVEGDPFKHKVDAVKSAKLRAEKVPNTFAVVGVEAMYQRAVNVTEVEVAS